MNINILAARASIGGLILGASMVLASGQNRQADNRTHTQLFGGILMRARPRAAPPPAVRKGRMTYEHEFKLRVVKEALARPPDNRIKPTVSFAA